MNKKNNLMRDLGIMAISVVLAIVLARTGVLVDFFQSLQEEKIICSFFAGVFFVSVFTVAPASVILVELAQTNSIFLVAFFGGLGALVGDLIIFRFLRDSISRSLLEKIRVKEESWLKSASRSKIFRFFMPFIGALIIISPFPDEIGLMMMGLSKVRTDVFIILAFFLNFLGILAIGEIFSK